MRKVPDSMTEAWFDPMKIGDKRPVVRATIQQQNLRKFEYDTAWAEGGYYDDGRHRAGHFTSAIFGDNSPYREIRDIQSCEWERSIGNDAATCTITFLNTEIQAIGSPKDNPENPDEFDKPGYFCADPETEVLTRQGWARYDQVEVGCEIYTVNPGTGLAEWRPVLEMFAKPYAGKMMRFSGKSISALVTPNHRWAVTNKYAESRNPGTLRFKEARELARHDMIPLARPSVDTTALYTPDFAALIGWVVSDGTLQKPGNGQRVCINQSVRANPEKCKEIRALLQRIGEPFSESVHRDDMMFFRFSGMLARAVRAVIPDKRLTMDFIEALDHQGRTALLDALIQGDGGVVGGGTRYVCTNNEEQAAIFAGLMARLGFASNTHKRFIRGNKLKTGWQSPGSWMFYVNLKTSRFTRVSDSHPEYEDYEGIVWCPRTDNGTFLARREGKVYFTGNTYNRGDPSTSPPGAHRWGYDEETGWNHVFMPDMVVKTFEGYGCDPSVTPPLDDNLLQSGVWLVDKVTYAGDLITLEMRDLSRLLLDQIVFPPIVPLSEYPMSFVHNHSENVDHRDVQGGAWWDSLKKYGVATSSNDIYVGKGFTNHPYPRYVSPTGGVDGHHASHVIMRHDPADPHAHPPDPGDADLIWRSTGQDHRNDFVWWQYNVSMGITEAGHSGGPSLRIGALRLNLAGGPYRVYVSIFANGKWVGKRKIPYQRDPDSDGPDRVDINADIPFVKSVIGDWTYSFDVILPRIYDMQKIRLTFTRLGQSGNGEHPFRASLREMKVYTGGDISFHKGQVLKVIGNYGDYTHIIKWVCAWGGWYWPGHSSGMDFMRIAGGYDQPATKDWITFNSFDPVLPKGRVWGDFMKTGTHGIADLTSDQFDKKPLMDIINYVRDLLGFLFFIDETGGVVWRMPNLGLAGDPQLGNYLSPGNIMDGSTNTGKPSNRGRYGRVGKDDMLGPNQPGIITLDEEETLLSYQVQLDSGNLRDRIFVANAVGGIGVVIEGFNLNPVGMRRIAGWSDQHFKTKQEARVMADMISAAQMFTYRQATATIPGYPAIQIDDMIRIFERVTDETYYHYVTGIKSSLDMQTGVWTYDLSTHWLGERPSDAWAVKVTELATVTQEYLHAVGYDPQDSEDNDTKPVPDNASGGTGGVGSGGG